MASEGRERSTVGLITLNRISRGLFPDSFPGIAVRFQGILGTEGEVPENVARLKVCWRKGGVCWRRRVLLRLLEWKLFGSSGTADRIQPERENISQHIWS